MGEPAKNDAFVAHETLMAMSHICSAAAAYAYPQNDDGEVRGQPPDIMGAFERAMMGLPFDDEEMLQLWATFLLGSQAVKKLYREQVGTRPNGEASVPAMLHDRYIAESG